MLYPAAQGLPAPPQRSLSATSELVGRQRCCRHSVPQVIDSQWTMLPTGTSPGDLPEMVLKKARPFLTGLFSIQSRQSQFRGFQMSISAGVCLVVNPGNRLSAGDQSPLSPRCSFFNASASICRTRSRVSPSDSPISLSVFGSESSRPNLMRSIVASR